MNNKLRLHELWRGLSNCEYKKNNVFNKKTFIHNCITEYKGSTYLVKSRFPISKYVKKKLGYVIYPSFYHQWSASIIYCPKTTYSPL